MFESREDTCISLPIAVVSCYMKVVIFAGGLGSRLSEETVLKPKPMVEIGGRPILWHIMKLYSHYGHREFIVCLGYKGHMIKEWFANYLLHNSDVSIDLGANRMEFHTSRAENWRVTLVDTGQDVGTATRLSRVKSYVGAEDFFLTYGDGVGNVDIAALLAEHRRQGKTATVTAVQPEGRFGMLDIGDDGATVRRFGEKIDHEGQWINGGFFVLRQGVFQYLPDHDAMWEREPLERLSSAGQLSAYRHTGFWKAMDTLRDKERLEELWKQPAPPWKIWSE